MTRQRIKKFAVLWRHAQTVEGCEHNVTVRRGRDFRDTIYTTVYRLRLQRQILQVTARASVAHAGQPMIC